MTEHTTDTAEAYPPPGSTVNGPDVLDLLPVGAVVMDHEGQRWESGPRKRDGRTVRARWSAGLGWAMASARLAERGPLTVMSVLQDHAPGAPDLPATPLASITVVPDGPNLIVVGTDQIAEAARHLDGIEGWSGSFPGVHDGLPCVRFLGARPLPATPAPSDSATAGAVERADAHTVAERDAIRRSYAIHNSYGTDHGMRVAKARFDAWLAAERAAVLHDPHLADHIRDSRLAGCEHVGSGQTCSPCLRDRLVAHLLGTGAGE